MTVHAVCDEQGLVTAAKVTPGNESEVEQVTELLEQVQRNCGCPKRLAADKGYDDSKLRRRLIEQDIRPCIPFRKRKHLDDGFTYNPEDLTLTCPAGKQFQGRNEHQHGGYVFYFSQKDCSNCSRTASCLGEGENRKRCYLNPEAHKYRVKGLKTAGRLRKGIERLFAHTKL
ncbi:MAG: transposase [Bacillota bacterium]|nr:transposase [Bacillota bacterium]